MKAYWEIIYKLIPEIYSCTEANRNLYLGEVEKHAIEEITRLVSPSPEVCAHLKTRYAGEILTFQDWVLSQTKPQIPLDLSWRMIPKPKQKVPSDFFSVCSQIFEALKAAQVRPSEWKSALQNLKGMPSRKPFYQLLWELYALYEATKKTWDFQDVLYQAALQIEENGKKVFVLAHRFLPSELHWMERCVKAGLTIDMLSMSSEGNKKKKIRAGSFQTMEEEVLWVVSDLKKKLQKLKPQEIFIFCQNKDAYEGIFQAEFFKNNLPEIARLAFQSQNIVFPDMKAVVVCGLVPAHEIELGLLDDEKQTLNQTLGRSVFKTLGDLQEELKQVLFWLANHTPDLTLLTSQGTALEELCPHQNVKWIHSRPKRKRTRLHVFDSDLAKPSYVAPKVYSVSMLEQFQRCAYGFYLSYGLKIYPEAIPQETLTPQEEGNILHAILYQWFVSRRNIEEVFQEVFFVYEGQLKKEILLSDRSRIEEIVREFIEQEADWQKTSSFQPKYFEWEFGKTDPLPLEWEGQTLYLRGKVDRIDIDPVRKRFRIVDYKTGSTVPSFKEVMSGEKFQLTLYALAVQNLLLKEYVPELGQYIRLKMPDLKKGFEVDTQEAWEDLKAKTLGVVFDLHQKIQSQVFQATPDNCFIGCERKFLCQSQITA